MANLKLVWISLEVEDDSDCISVLTLTFDELFENLTTRFCASDIVLK